MFVEVLNRFGRPRGITGAQAALGWMLQKGDGIVPIPGTTKLSHLEENIRAANLAVSPEEWKELEDALSRVEIVTTATRRNSKNRFKLVTFADSGGHTIMSRGVSAGRIPSHGKG